MNSVSSSVASRDTDSQVACPSGVARRRGQWWCTDLGNALTLPWSACSCALLIGRSGGSSPRLPARGWVVCAWERPRTAAASRADRGGTKAARGRRPVRLVCGVLSQHLAEKSGDIHGRAYNRKDRILDVPRCWRGGMWWCCCFEKNMAVCERPHSRGSASRVVVVGRESCGPRWSARGREKVAVWWPGRRCM